MNRTKYMIWDLETQNISTCGRFCNPFDPVNYIVARGWKVQGDSTNQYQYITENIKTFTSIPEDVLILVGHNIKFDLLFEWPWIKESFLRHGGLIWDTQLAEYLLNAQRSEYFLNSLDQLAPMYGGSTKLDVVKKMWDSGVKTSDIPEDLLIEYLVGPDLNGGDIGNTEKIFLGQIKRAKEQGQFNMILARMESLLCTTEMEYNGLFIDMEEAARCTVQLQQQSFILQAQLDSYLKDLPSGFVFNWNSRTHLSALLFGGTVKYRSKEPIIIDGKIQYTQEVLTEQVGVYKSGRRKGDPILRQVKRDTNVPKYKMQERLHTFPGFCPGPEQARLNLKDALGGPLFSTSSDVIQSLRGSGIPFLDLLVQRSDLTKDLSTYYISIDPDGSQKGMLTHVNPDHRIHHSLNHTSTVTTRLSSTSPNLQNIPRDDTSTVKKMFKSRFQNGRMIELDYSTLEIVGQAWLSQDPGLIQDIISGVDFHCKRVSVQYNIPYQDALYLCKSEDAPEHETWKHRRTKAKVFSFQRAYGAGATKIAESTGMDLEEVKALIQAEEKMYPTLLKFNASIHEEVLKNSVPFRDSTGKVYHRSYWTAPTSTRYSFRTYDAPSWLQDQGVLDSYKPTEEKNYPVQGTSGEFVQLALGKLFRHFLMNRNYNNKALLVNTVHDCVWADAEEIVHVLVARDMKRIMEGIPSYIKEVYNLDCPVPFRVSAEAGINMYSKTSIKDI